MKVNEDIVVLDPHYGRAEFKAGEEVPAWAEKIIPADKVLLDATVKKAPAKKAPAKKAPDKKAATAPAKKAPAKATPSAPAPDPAPAAE